VIWIAVMLLIGVFFSAFFSGSETGFYRAARVRLVLDGRGGDPVARGLLHLTNYPSLFVATTLVGNNLANYLASLAIVLFTQQLLSGASFGAELAELAAPVALAPVLFVLGELLPKYLFFHAPNRLLRRAGPIFLLCTVLFAPVSALLFALGRLLQRVLGESPEHVRLTLARTELASVFEEGHEVGILKAAQRRLVQELFAVAGRPVMRFCTPIGRVVSVREDAGKADVLRLARRHRAAVLPVERVRDRRRELIGYVRTVDLHLTEGDAVGPIRPLMEIPHTETHIAALTRMQSAKETAAAVVDESGKTVGFLTAGNLTDPLFRAG